MAWPGIVLLENWVMNDGCCHTRNSKQRVGYSQTGSGRFELFRVLREFRGCFLRGRK